MVKPYDLAYQKLCYFKISEILEKKTKNVLENGLKTKSIK